ncbi:MAG: hypothetical protein K5756_00575 [Clostridiales bacterium]|nr:hypothetical protein [Clostridiales bacterium]
METRVVSNVPIRLNLENSIPTKLNLTPFGETQYYVDVTVKGKRVLINQPALTEDDLVATVATNQVNSPGNHSLQVKVSPKNENADFEIIEYSNDYIQVYFDTYKEKEYTLEPEIICDKLVPEGYMCDKDDEEDVFASTKKIKIAGPASEIDKIDKVIAQVVIDEPLTKNQTFKAEIIPVNEKNSSEQFKYLTYGVSEGDISVTVRVRKKDTLPVGVSFKNLPAYYIKNPLKVTVRPSAADIAMEEDKLESAKSVILGAVDFNALSPSNNKFTFKASDVTEAKILDGTKEFHATVDMSGFGTVTGLTVQNIPDAAAKDGKTVTAVSNEIKNIVAVGPEDMLSQINSEKLVARLDVSNVDTGKTTQVIPVIVELKDMDRCWIYGSYSVTVTVK